MQNFPSKQTMALFLANWVGYAGSHARVFTSMGIKTINRRGNVVYLMSLGDEYVGQC